MEHKRGKLYIVGIGPGGKEHLTFRAVEALRDADVIIGYSLYLDLIAHLLADKEVIRSAMGDERERALNSIERAVAGGRVALVSGGDPGIYGMAGPVFEALFTVATEEAEQIQVEVIPGVTAASACSAIVGAPLAQDFAVVSLSDRFVPWDVITRRLQLVLDAGMALVLYEPASRHRPTHMAEAWKVLSRFRGPDTPVAVVRDASRADQSAIVTTLAHLLEQKFDMHTTVIVGGSQTLARGRFMVTPRFHQA